MPSCRSISLINALQGGIPSALKLFQCMCCCLMCSFFVCLFPNYIVCLVIGTRLSSRGQFVCLVNSFRYSGLAMLALAAFGRVRALCAHCGPSGPAMALKRWRRGGHPGPLWGSSSYHPLLKGGGTIPPSKFISIQINNEPQGGDGLILTTSPPLFIFWPWK